MPVQTLKKKFTFKDGCKVQVKAQGDIDWFDVGAIAGDATATFNFDEDQYESGNAGKAAKRIKNMTVDGGFTLVNLEADGVAKLSGGLFTVEETNSTPTSTIQDQIVAAGWADNKVYELTAYEAASTVKLKLSAKPVLTSVTLDAAGTPEVLTEDNDYVIVERAEFRSGYGIQFISANMSTNSPTTKAITIVYGTNTPVASYSVSCGSSTFIVLPVEMKFEHTDSDGKIRFFHMPHCEPNSGGFQFNFGGANSDGVEEMPITFTASLDTSLTDGKQLFSWVYDEGAQ